MENLDRSAGLDIEFWHRRYSTTNGYSLHSYMSSWIYDKHDWCVTWDFDDDCTYPLTFAPSYQIAFYVTARLFIVLLHISFAIILPHMRPIMTVFACVNASAAAIWIGSIYVSIPQRFAILWVAITIGLIPDTPSLDVLDWFGYLSVVVLIRVAPYFSTWLAEKLKKTFSYYPGIRNVCIELVDLKLLISNTTSIEWTHSSPLFSVTLFFPSCTSPLHTWVLMRIYAPCRVPKLMK